MKVAIGTLSENKNKYVKNTFNKFGLDSHFYSFDVDTGISESPISEKETIKGSMTRALNAYNEQKDIDLAIGLEGGIDFTESACHYVCVASIYYKNNYYVGIGSKLNIPNEIAVKLKDDNTSLADEIRNYKTTDKFNSELVEMIISRKEMFEEAIRNALLQIRI